LLFDGSASLVSRVTPLWPSLGGSHVRRKSLLIEGMTVTIRDGGKAVPAEILIAWPGWD
jgi:hypothetical protein